MAGDSRDEWSPLNERWPLDLMLQRHRFALSRLVITQAASRLLLIVVSVLALYVRSTHITVQISLSVICVLIGLSWWANSRVVSSDLRRLESSIVESSSFPAREIFIGAGVNAREFAQPAQASFLRYEPFIWTVSALGSIQISVLAL